MKVEEIICDQCGFRKGKENHWFTLILGPKYYHLCLECNPREESNSESMKDICSMNCASRALQEFMSVKENEIEEMMEYIDERLPQ